MESTLLKTTAEEAINKFVGKWQEVIDAYYAKHYSNIPTKKLIIKYNKKYVKIIDDDSSVSAFIDPISGEIFKAAGWNAPAKHARGNIFSEHDGMESIDSMGFVKYLR